MKNQLEGCDSSDNSLIVLSSFLSAAYNDSQAAGLLHFVSDYYARNALTATNDELSFSMAVSSMRLAVSMGEYIS